MQAIPLSLPAETARLSQWLLSEPWPFHGQPQASETQLREKIGQGYFSGSNHQSFWLATEQDAQAGFLRIFDLNDIAEDGYPMFDLRIRQAWRGQGLGRQALQWLTHYVFETWPALDRMAGSTRVDNQAMRRVFHLCGYVKEGHYRQDWPTADGRCLDTVHYAILRKDWLTGHTTPVNWQDE